MSWEKRLHEASGSEMAAIGPGGLGHSRGHGGHLRPEDVHADAFEIAGAQNHEEVAQGAEVGEVLEPLRHGGDGKSEA